MQQLSGLDATFLYMENPRTPMHIGGVYIYALPESGEGFVFDSFLQFFESRLHLSRVFRQRIVEAPLHMGHPYWIEDADFDLENHLSVVGVPEPGTLESLMELAANFYSRPLDRTKPLWEIVFVTGLEKIKGLPKGAFAMVSKVHHAAIDGGSGVEIMGALHDLQVEPRIVKPPEEAWEGERVPTGLELVARSYGKAVGTPLRLLKFVSNTVGGAIDVAAEIVKNRISSPPFPFSAPPTFFNTTVTSHKTFSGESLSLDRIKALRKALPGATVNDIVLAICSGSLRNYLLEREELPEKPLVAMAPISVRKESQKKAAGNQVSAMLVSLATTEADPLKRLEMIRESAGGSKVYSKALGANQIMDFVPSEVAALAARLYTRMHVAEKLDPVYNMVITNVPGPPMPLFLNRAQLISHYGLGITLDGQGLFIAVFSYAGRVFISTTSCREIMPDLRKLTMGFKAALLELEVAAGITPATPRKKTRKSKKPASKSTQK